MKNLRILLFCFLLSSNAAYACNGDDGTCDFVEPTTLAECIKLDVKLLKEGHIAFNTFLVQVAADCELYDLADFAGRL